MIRLASIFGLLGLIAATALIIWSGYDDVVLALKQAGWGIVWTSFYHIIPMFISIVGWQALMPGRRRPGKAFFLYVLWLRAAVNNLMPVARIGGEILAVRVMIKHGVYKTTAIASTVVETTMSVMGEFFFTLIGISLFVLHVSDNNLTMQLLVGLVVVVPILGGLLWIQRVGFFGLLAKLFNLMFRDRWKNFAGDTAKLDRAVHTMYRRNQRVLFCGVMQFLSWALCSIEIWLALYYIGHPLPLLECMMIEALIQAAASAAFIVPGALGVQEAGFLVFGQMLGLTPEVAAALAVIRRCRDLLLYVPGLIVWQIQEGRWLLKARKI